MGNSSGQERLLLQGGRNVREVLDCQAMNAHRGIAGERCTWRAVGEVMDMFEGIGGMLPVWAAVVIAFVGIFTFFIWKAGPVILTYIVYFEERERAGRVRRATGFAADSQRRITSPGSGPAWSNSDA